MATANDIAAKSTAGKQSPSIIVTLAVLTVIAGTFGAGFGFLVPGPQPTTVIGADHPIAESAAPARPISRFPLHSTEVILKPIIAPLAHSNVKKIRVESSLIVMPSTALPPALRAEIEQDIFAFVSGVAFNDLSDARGLKNLRDDLDDLIKTRGQGIVLGLLITGLAFE